MDLRTKVEAVFTQHGVLSAALESFSPRSGQMEMARAVASAIEDGTILAVEAGTGVGKTYAYLVPALLSGERVMVSTATKALQDQLFVRDIPRLLTALGLSLRVALLKGRSSYLCMQRLGTARQAGENLDGVALRQLARVEDWALSTDSGDMAEVNDLDDASPVLGLVTSTRDNCLGSQCPQANHCHTQWARQNAMKADVVVVNHHLFFADLNIRESGVAELLPSVRSVIFDEAHQLNDIGVQFLARQFSTGQLKSLGRDLVMVGQNLARGYSDWLGLQAQLERAAQGLEEAVRSGGTGARLGWIDAAPEGVLNHDWHASVNACVAALQSAQAISLQMDERGPEFTALAQRADQIANALLPFSHLTPTGSARWAERGTHLRLSESPLDIAQAMRFTIGPDPDVKSQKSWVFTSATLGVDDQLSWFVTSCGLDNAQVLKVESPFDYVKQASVYVPPDFPKPSEAGHTEAVARLIFEGASRLGGRTLVLTTTTKAMHALGRLLRALFADSGQAMDILVQGEAAKRALIDRFCRDPQQGETGCILVAAASFWEGIDISGDALQLLVIDKLPFAPPDDPLMQSRTQAMQALGKNAFKELHLPTASIALKQGAGRLIRSERDHGILVVCDVRLLKMGYGRKLMSALPPMQRLQDHAAWLQALNALRDSLPFEPGF